MSRLRFIEHVIYRLKRRYGQVVDIVQRDTSVTNLQTGVKTVVKSAIRVDRAIVLPSRIHRTFEYDLTFIATNKNFTYGGHFDVTRRRFIIDRKDLPADFEIKNGMYFVTEEKRYDVEEVSEFEQKIAYLVIGKQVVDHEPDNVVGSLVASDLLLEQSVQVVVE